MHLPSENKWFVVIFTDRPGHGHLRAAHLPAHIAWLAAHQDVVRIAGSLREELDQVPQGGLWIVQAPDKASVAALVQTDPFWSCGLRESVKVLHWSRALEQQVLI